MCSDGQTGCCITIHIVLEKYVPDFYMSSSVTQLVLVFEMCWMSRCHFFLYYCILMTQEFMLWISLKSDRIKGILCVSAPGAFIQHNTIVLGRCLAEKEQRATWASKVKFATSPAPYPWAYFLWMDKTHVLCSNSVSEIWLAVNAVYTVRRV